MLLALLVAVFSSNNNIAVEINLYPLPYEFSISLVVVVFVSILAGVLMGGTFTSIRVFYWKRRAKHAQKNVEKIKQKTQPEETNNLLKIENNN